MSFETTRSKLNYINMNGVAAGSRAKKESGLYRQVKFRVASGENREKLDAILGVHAIHQKNLDVVRRQEQSGLPHI
jgi:hypothetical protein